MLVRWLIRFWRRHDARRILRGLSPEDCEQLRSTPETELIRFHFGLGRGLRNAFVRGRFPGLHWHCHRVVEQQGEPMSLDALSSVAIHEVWKAVQPRA